LIGLDFDNTLVDYTAAFREEAAALGLSMPGASKTQIRDTLRLQPDGEILWQKLQARVYVDRGALGRAAGEAAASKLRELLAKKPVSVIFAAAPSQNEFLGTLVAAKGIDWSRVTAFHMDEYVGLPGTAPQSFGRWLRDRLFDKVKPGKVHYLDGMAKNAGQECARYTALLKAAPPDVTCMGIGENGHLAFNDPPVADF